ncbi:MAG TPA: hypothetical protein VM327_03165 [Candidatus Thermoplasmatota archaeon]|nr:hypothetical protein [Candidatus Thermoplasmatota archaeon]
MSGRSREGLVSTGKDASGRVAGACVEANTTLRETALREGWTPAEELQRLSSYVQHVGFCSSKADHHGARFEQVAADEGEPAFQVELKGLGDPLRGDVPIGLDATCLLVLEAARGTLAALPSFTLGMLRFHLPNVAPVSVEGAVFHLVTLRALVEQNGRLVQGPMVSANLEDLQMEFLTFRLPGWK